MKVKSESEVAQSCPTLLDPMNCREETHTGLKIAGRNINNLRYADDTTPMAESEEDLKNLLMKVKERAKKLA